MRRRIAARSRMTFFDDEDAQPRRFSNREPDGENGDNGDEEEEIVDQLGGDAMDETPYRAPRSRRQYKIQEVIKRRQVLLIQVVKEERGNKGAALTTYLSLAGRYSVLMPNTARGGGISRKITDATDRKRLKEIAQELEVPGRHGRDSPHGGRGPDQAGSQARLRISDAHVGDGARTHAVLIRSVAGL